jgi:hypothetical protein
MLICNALQTLSAEGLRNIFPRTEIGEFPIMGNKISLKYMLSFPVKFL